MVQETPTGSLSPRAGKAPRTGGNRGSNQIAVRSYNERLILQLLRWNPRLTKADLGRATDLSANAVSVIIRALDAEGLILKEEPIRGRIGQPSTPIRLNPDARFYLGCKIGRRSADLALVDFEGGVRGSSTISYEYPEPASLRTFLKEAIPNVLKEARRIRRDVHGFGIAMPSEIWSWTQEIGVPAGALDVWRDLDPASLLPKGAPWVPLVANDATAACVAETTFKRTGDLQDGIYLYVGTFIGGGIILNGSVFFGRTGSAGGFGPFRVPGGAPGSDRLMDQASLIVLERLLCKRGERNVAQRIAPEGWSVPDDILETWLDLTARGMAHTIASCLSIIDFQAVIIDGSLPAHVRSRLVEMVQSAFLAMDLQGLTVPEISEGHYGPLARAIGAAALPLNASYAIDQNTLLRGT